MARAVCGVRRPSHRPAAQIADTGPCSGRGRGILRLVAVEELVHAVGQIGIGDHSRRKLHLCDRDRPRCASTVWRLECHGDALELLVVHGASHRECGRHRRRGRQGQCCDNFGCCGPHDTCGQSGCPLRRCAEGNRVCGDARGAVHRHHGDCRRDPGRGPRDAAGLASCRRARCMDEELLHVAVCASDAHSCFPCIHQRTVWRNKRIRHLVRRERGLDQLAERHREADQRVHAGSDPREQRVAATVDAARCVSHKPMNEHVALNPRIGTVGRRNRPIRTKDSAGRCRETRFHANCVLWTGLE
eukprot:comp22524_c0_seq3/m.56653 comp22524_c0_seq3/g.56653  ORF comp22524_c0_seq3/g.56653 comp22524_c0_seq3/m.56653 type:complete len:302 (-) comp22524_c0_seq3:81-986(-)